jgi:predicted RNA-binding Zn ribbon-like protein
MSETVPSSSRFLFLAGNAALDFVNTEMRDASGQVVDLLDSNEALIEWCEASRLFDRAALERFRESWRAPARARGVLPHARLFRASIAEVVDLVIGGKRYAAAAVAALAAPLAAYPLRRRPFTDGPGIRATLEPMGEIRPVDQLLGALAESALDLFSTAQPEHIRKCAHPECVLVFHDTTKNHRRQWCSMDVCGNRAKAARFRAQHARRP